MSRHAPSLALLAALVTPLSLPAQGDRVIALSLAPADTPDPFQKYRLFPDPREQRPGNAAALHYRTLALFVENTPLLEEVRQQYWHDWLEGELKDLPLAEVEIKLGRARPLLRETGVAGRYRDCDWLLEGREEGIGLLLPDVQGFRMIGTLLAVQARFHVARGQWSEACAALRDGYTLAHHLGRGPTYIHVLVGAAIARLMDVRLEELLAQPGSPCLYWSLVTMPRPLLDPLQAVRQEGSWLEASWPWLRDLPGGPMTLQQVQDGLMQLERLLDGFKLKKPGKLARAAVLAAHEGPARVALGKMGYTAARLEAMPALQVIALWAYLSHRQAADELFRWAHAPQGFRHPRYQEAKQRYAASIDRLDRMFFHGLLRGLGGDLAVERVFVAAARGERRHAALCCVEALRLEAARTDRWPAALADLTQVPVPRDPITGQPFAYRLEGDTARLSAPLRPGEKPDPIDALVYSLTLKKR